MTSEHDWKPIPNFLFKTLFMRIVFYQLFILLLFMAGFHPLAAQMKQNQIKQYHQHKKEKSVSSKNTKLKSLRIGIPEKVRPTLGASYQYQSIPQSLIPEIPPKVVHSPQNQLPIFIKGNVNTNDFIMPREGSPEEMRSYAYLYGVRNTLQIDNPVEEFQITKVNEDHLGNRHIKMQQLYKGIPIDGGEVILHEKNEVIESLNGRPFPTPQIEHLNPTIAEEIALKFAWENVSHQTTINNYNPKWSAHPRSAIKLVVFHPEDQPDNARLTWKIALTPNLSSHWTYYVDAHTGEILLNYNTVCKFYHPIVVDEEQESLNTSSKKLNERDLFSGPETAVARDLSNNNRTIRVYEDLGNFFLLDVSRAMFDAQNSNLPSDPTGAIWTIDAQGTAPQNDDFEVVQVFTNDRNNWEDLSSISAHYNAAQAYEYYLNTFNRNSINGQGGNIISIINVADEDGEDMDNAFWNGVAMFYGNGDRAFSPLAEALDVAGHEMTHGVIQAEANLNYISQSGALNESYADIFGVMIDRDDWQLGEDVVNSNIFRSGALRDVQNPNNGGRRGDNGWQPAHMDEFVVLPETEEGDNGGVHVNSGIPNRAFFLVANAIGRDRAEQIYYDALQNRLVRSSQFIDMRIAAIEAANALYGQAEANAVASAYDAVGIFEAEGTDTQTEFEENDGQEFVLYADANQNVLKIATPNGSIVENPLTNIGPSNKPSITDDGSIITYVDQDNHIQVIIANGFGGYDDPFILSQEPVWRNVAISKDGARLAAITTDRDSLIYIFDLSADPIVGQTFELSNPTFAEGVETGDVRFADVLEWNATGDFLMYDAFNEIETLDGAIDYWDIGFLRAWDISRNDFGDGLITKLFTGLPENTSVGNPTFAKNAPFVVAFDFVEDDADGTRYLLRTANIETGDVVTVFENSVLHFPNYSVDDKNLIFDAFFYE